MLLIEYTTRYTDSYYSKASHCVIPGGWDADVASDLPDGAKLYTGRHPTEREAIADLAAQCKVRYAQGGVLRRAE